MNRFSPIRWRALAAAAGVAALAMALSSPAHAWWRGGFFVGVAPGPFVVGPPAVYAPPVYAPPPVYGAPPPYGWEPGSPDYGAPEAYQTPPDYGRPRTYQTPPDYGYQYGSRSAPSQGASCYAQGYVCPLERPAPAGAACSCPSNRGGRVWGQTG